jgi:hypothetical protein
VRCGAVRCGRLVQGGHGAGAARVRFFLVRLHAAAIGAVMVGLLCAGFSIVSSVVIAEQRVVVELHQHLSHLVAGRVGLDRGARWAPSAGASSTGAGSKMRSSSRPRRERQRAQHCATSKSKLVIFCPYDAALVAGASASYRKRSLCLCARYHENHL